MKSCDNEHYEWDSINGKCICVEQMCLKNQLWDFNKC